MFVLFFLIFMGFFVVTKYLEYYHFYQFILKISFYHLQFQKFDLILFQISLSFIFLHLYQFQKIFFILLHFQNFYRDRSPFKVQTIGRTWSQDSECFGFSKKLWFLSLKSTVSRLKILLVVSVYLLHKFYLDDEIVFLLLFYLFKH